MPDPCITLLEELVSIDSVNPSLVAGAAGERAIADRLAAYMRELGLEVHTQTLTSSDRSNVIGVLETGVPGPSLMFCGHIDTVGVEGMASPFTPVIRDGRLYGRGSQDMKGGVAAMIDAARMLQERSPARGRLILAAVVDEEFASIGADALVREWRADAAVVTEPTDLQIGVGHKGFAWFNLETRGKAAHGSRPRDGRDAIFRMGRVLTRLEALDRDLQSRPPHPILGTPSLHASIIQGGREWSVYPDACQLSLERRTVIGESATSGAEELRGILDALAVEDAEFDAVVDTVFSRPPYETPRGHPVTTRLQQCANALGVPADTVGMSFWTDAAVLGEAGIPSVLFGPGGAGLHSTEEYVRIDEVLVCRNVLASLAEGWLAS
jgi:acetylornithine deacetylase